MTVCTYCTQRIICILSHVYFYLDPSLFGRGGDGLALFPQAASPLPEEKRRVNDSNVISLTLW